MWVVGDCRTGPQPSAAEVSRELYHLRGFWLRHLVGLEYLFLHFSLGSCDCLPGLLHFCFILSLASSQCFFLGPTVLEGARVLSGHFPFTHMTQVIWY